MLPMGSPDSDHAKRLRSWSLEETLAGAGEEGGRTASAKRQSEYISEKHPPRGFRPRVSVSLSATSLGKRDLSLPTSPAPRP